MRLQLLLPQYMLLPTGYGNRSQRWLYMRRSQTCTILGYERHPDKPLLSVLEHPYGMARNANRGQTLIRPGEISPQYVESIGIALGKYKYHRNAREYHGSERQPFGNGFLIKAQRVGNRHPEGSQSRISRCDRKDYDSKQSDDPLPRFQVYPCTQLLWFP